MHTLAQDARHALRAFRRTPVFTAGAVLSLAIGIGANSAIFSVASALLLRPLPYRQADRLAILWNRSPGLGITEDWFSTAQYFDIRATRAFEDVAIAIGANVNLTGDGEPERIGTIRVSSNLLPLLGVHPQLGRAFDPADDVPGRAGTAILGHGTWVRRYGGDPAVLGRTLILNGQPYEVIGVLPATFSLPREVMPTLGGAEDAEILLPLPLGSEAATFRGREDYNVLARLPPGVPMGAAQARMDALTARLRGEHPDVYPPNGGLTFDVVPLQEQVVGDVRAALAVLVGAVALVLVIACANVANLLLSRALARQKEIAVRAAIGAARLRIIRQLLTESVLLALAGGAVGVLFAFWTLEGIRALGAASVPRIREIGIDVPVLLFTLALSAAAGVLFGLAPAWRLSRADLTRALASAARTPTGALGGRGNRLRRLLIVAEFALSVMPLVGAGLLLRSFARLQQVPPGFVAEGVLTLEVTMSGRRYPAPTAVVEAYRQAWERLQRLPGVQAVGAVSALPLSQMFAWGPITVEGRPRAAGEAFINADQRIVAAGYFGTMRIPLLHGRLPDERDTRTTTRVAVVDEHMATQLWPAADAVGKRIRIGSDENAPWTTVVGVVGRVKQYTLDADSRIALYVPHTQFPTRALNIVIRSAGRPEDLAAAVRAQLRALDPDLPVYNVRTMEQRVSESLARRRFSMLLLTLFAALALGLAALGVYSVVAYSVSHGMRELGIRAALGATPGRILSFVVGQTMAVAAVGIVAGIAGALVATRWLRAMLFGVDARDPVTFLAVTGLLAFIALVASGLPAVRGARVDAAAVMRD
ncbi:MAG TPA: ABC transporter permease [Vicinamibacterales bacterium]|nr:ABC transporter permease [Vicinamibacterales bacterium]